MPSEEVVVEIIPSYVLIAQETDTDNSSADAEITPIIGIIGTFIMNNQ